MTLPFIVWTHDGKAPEVLARAATLPEARALWLNSKHAAISSAGVLHDVRGTTNDKLARAMEQAAASAWSAEGATAPAALAKTSRPAAVRPPLPRRRTAPVAVEAPAAVEPAAPAPPPADSPDAKVARLQRLVDQLSRERDAHRDRAEQLRGEVEGLTTDLGVARRELAVTVAQLNDLSDSTKTELATLRDENAQLRAAPAAALVPAQVLLDELMLERIALRAARRAVALQGDATKLDRLCRDHGGVDAVVRIVEGALALRRAVG